MVPIRVASPLQLTKIAALTRFWLIGAPMTSDACLFFLRCIAISFVLAFRYALPAKAVTYIQGFDVYSGDGAVNWTSVKNGGYSFAFVKATEGVNFTDSRFATNMAGATSAGVYVGPYHFCRIDSYNGVPFTSYNGGSFPVGSD